MFETHADLTIRRLTDTDAEALDRLAQRDSSAIPSGSLLAAIAPGGALLAAISIETRQVVADPFLPSEHAVGLLQVRARQIGGNSDHDQHQGRRRRRQRSRASLPSSPPGAGGRLLTLSGLRPPS